MSNFPSQQGPWKGIACSLLAACALVAAASPWMISSAVQAQRRPATLQHFKSGSERSEELLREIATTLKRMDERLGRLEQVAQRTSQGGAHQ